MNCSNSSTVLHLSHALVQNEDLKQRLHANQDACKVAPASNEQWPGIQFFDGNALDFMLDDQSHEVGLLSKLIDEVISKPPHELMWMKGHPHVHEIKNAIVGSEYPSRVLVNLPEDYLSDVLALRGLIAGGVLRHCLVKRHRVNYGVARPGKKKLAVPFRFADTPDERSEFAHPDCAIGFTTLSYYYDGLSEEELMQALKTLMTLGENAQRNFYNRWLEISSDKMETVGPDVTKSIDAVEKIDLTNDAQFEKLYCVYSRNMAAIDFYLNYCVFPAETDQFDSR